jgi:hypothetical protein
VFGYVKGNGFLILTQIASVAALTSLGTGGSPIDGQGENMGVIRGDFFYNFRGVALGAGGGILALLGTIGSFGYGFFAPGMGKFFNRNRFCLAAICANIGLRTLFSAGGFPLDCTGSIGVLQKRNGRGIAVLAMNTGEGFDTFCATGGRLCDLRLVFVHTFFFAACKHKAAKG